MKHRYTDHLYTNVLQGLANGRWPDGSRTALAEVEYEPATPVADTLWLSLTEYVDGSEHRVSVPLRLHGLPDMAATVQAIRTQFEILAAQPFHLLGKPL